MIRIRHDGADGEQAWHVAAGFPRQLQGPEIDGFAGAAVAPDGLAHVAFAGIVGSERQQPVTGKLGVQLFQVVEGCTGGFDHVAAAVVPPAVSQAVEAPRGWYELPYSRRPCRGIGEGLVSALHHRQHGELPRQVAALHLGDDVMQIKARAIGDPIHVSLVALIPLCLAGETRAVFHIENEACPGPMPQIGFLRRRNVEGARERSRRMLVVDEHGGVHHRIPGIVVEGVVVVARRQQRARVLCLPGVPGNRPAGRAGAQRQRATGQYRGERGATGVSSGKGCGLGGPGCCHSSREFPMEPPASTGVILEVAEDPVKGAVCVSRPGSAFGGAQAPPEQVALV